MRTLFAALLVAACLAPALSNVANATTCNTRCYWLGDTQYCNTSCY